MTDSYFQSLLNFNAQNLVASSVNQTNTDKECIDLSQFSFTAVSSLIEFIYTGKFAKPHSVQECLDFFQLADFTSNDLLCDLLLDQFEAEYFKPENIINMILHPSGKTIKMRDRAIKYLLKNRKEVKQVEDFDEMFASLVKGSIFD
jgi:hypothetical protein